MRKQIMQMTPDKYFSMFNSGKFHKELEEFHVNCSVSINNIDDNESMMTWINYSNENKEKIKSKITASYNQKDVTKVKTQVL